MVTLRTMRRLARNGLSFTNVRTLAADVHEIAQRERTSAASEIRALLLRRFRFRFDPPGIELVKGPEILTNELLRDRFAEGDCDDAAILAAALAHALGIPARFVAVGFQAGGPFRHVYTEVWTPRGWLDVDVTRLPQYPPGLKIRRRRFFKI